MKKKVYFSSFLSLHLASFLYLDIVGKVDLAGSYGCEVSSEAPSFETDYREANMSVAVPPKSAPVLEGVRPSYEVGEILQAECTSGLSYPPAILTFILNGKEVSRWCERRQDLRQLNFREVAWARKDGWKTSEILAITYET